MGAKEKRAERRKRRVELRIERDSTDPAEVRKQIAELTALPEGKRRSRGSIIARFR